MPRCPPPPPQVVYDTFVLPPNPIVDYVTKYSGISEGTLAGVTTTLADVHRVLLGDDNAGAGWSPWVTEREGVEAGAGGGEGGLREEGCRSQRSLFSFASGLNHLSKMSPPLREGGGG